jgi:hypothetical protein
MDEQERLDLSELAISPLGFDLVSTLSSASSADKGASRADALTRESRS